MARSTRESKQTIPVIGVLQSPYYAKNLTGHVRKLKDVCADFYKFAQNVNTAISKGSPMVQKLAEILLNEMKNDSQLAIEETLKDDVEKLCFKLVCDEMMMTSSISRMENCLEQLNCLCALLTSEHQLASTSFLSLTDEFVPLQTWPVFKFYEEALYITSMYRKEVAVKQEFITNLCNQTTSDGLNRYLLLWKHQREIEKCKPNLESFVVECGLRRS